VSDVPRVSVIVPSFNAAASIERALGTALAQTMADLEVIVVDDASHDGSADIARRIAGDDPRVRVLINERNAGPSASRNLAIIQARGDWVAPLDADDLWLPERLERMLAVADSADAVSDDILVERSQGDDVPQFWSLLEHKGLSIRGPRNLSLAELVRRDLGLLKPIVRRSFLERTGVRYDVDLRLGEDFKFYFELVAAGARWIQLPDPLYVYSRQTSSISRDLGTLARCKVETVHLLLQHPGARADRDVVAALRWMLQDWQGQIAFANVRQLLEGRRFRELALLVRREPSLPALVARRLSGNLLLRGRRRLRNPRRPSPARLLS